MFYLPTNYLSILPAVSTVAAMVGRIPQIILNYKNKHTGQVYIIYYYYLYIVVGIFILLLNSNGWFR